MITKLGALGDAEIDYATALYGPAPTVAELPSAPLPTIPQLSQADLLAWGANAGTLQDELTAGIHPSAAQSISNAISKVLGQYPYTPISSSPLSDKVSFVNPLTNKQVITSTSSLFVIAGLVLGTVWLVSMLTGGGGGGSSPMPERPRRRRNYA